jgi:drug/metabolite transporter (DMT)-like permease
MALHRSSGRWRLGLALALVTAGFWATLPAALKIALADLDPWTLTWVRFLFAFVVLALWLGARGRLAGFRGLSRGHWLLLALAAASLIGNYLLYLIGLDRTSPGNAQLLIQAAPLLMALGGIAVFGERYGTGQWLGMAAIVAGLVLFFRDQAGANAAGPGYLAGSALVLAAAASWAIYALAQKQLLQRLGSASILLVIYLAASVVLLPLADPAALLRLDTLALLMVGYAAVNTLGAYGAFAEALAHWEASRVSAVLALTPVLAVATVELVHGLAPALLAAESINAMGWIGAGMVVVGSILSSLLGRRAIELPVAVPESAPESTGPAAAHASRTQEPTR